MSKTNKVKVGFIGLGLMGEPMARNILQKGFELFVYNRTASKANKLKKEGAKVLNSPKEVAEASDIVVTMVTAPKDVQEVLFGSNGVVQGAKKGLIVVDMSTIGPQAAQAIFKQLADKQIQFLDAPVTGSTVRAISGELTIFVGGKKSVFDKALPVLKAMGKDVFHIGETGQGQAIKLVNNLFVGSSLAILAEGMLLADAQGLSRKKVMQYLENVPAVSGLMKMKMPNMVDHKFKTAFSISNMSKDLELARAELKKKNKTLPVLEQSSKLYRQLISEDQGELDNSAVLLALEADSKTPNS